MIYTFCLFQTSDVFITSFFVLKKTLIMTNEDPLRDRMDEEGKRATDLMFSKHYMLTGIILGYIVGTGVVFIGGGYMLDQFFNTYPTFMAIGVILSFIATQYLLYRKFKNQ
jgi:F0F1-type ATP synthase assembly protein I